VVESTFSNSGNRVRGLAFFALVLIAQGMNSTSAQNVQAVNDIYRNMYQAQADRDRLNAAQRQATSGTRVEPVPRTNTFPGQVVTPAQPTLVPPSLPPSAIPNSTPRATNTATPNANLGSTASSRTAQPQQANWFLDSLASIRDNVGRLIPELQRYAMSFPQARQVIGDVYQIEAEANSLHARTRNGESIQSIFAGYQQMDVRWQDVSYRLRASGSLDSRLLSLVNAIDNSFQTIDSQLNVKPPIDRVRLRDLMIVTLTFMDAMFDDIRLSPNAFNQAETLIRDGRILRERLRQESYKIDRADYDEVVSSYTGFVNQWRGYATRLYSLNDAHVNQRLDSIRRQGDEVYASLRIQAASDRKAMQFAGQRLTASLVALQDQLIRWGTSRLPADQLRFSDTVRGLIDRSQRLESELSRGSALTNASLIFTEMDRLWTDGLRSMRAVDARSGLQAPLVQVDVIFAELRDMLQVGPWQSQSDLLNVAASLEAAADDFNIDVQRYKRYLTPNQFRDSLSEISDDIFDSSRDLHRMLDENKDFREASRMAQRIVERWQQLTPMLGEVTQRGLSQSRTDQLYEGYRQMQPLVAQTASLLLN